MTQLYEDIKNRISSIDQNFGMLVYNMDEITKKYGSEIYKAIVASHDSTISCLAFIHTQS